MEWVPLIAKHLSTLKTPCFNISRVKMKCICRKKVIFLFFKLMYCLLMKKIVSKWKLLKDLYVLRLFTYYCKVWECFGLVCVHQIFTRVYNTEWMAYRVIFLPKCTPVIWIWMVGWWCKLDGNLKKKCSFISTLTWLIIMESR